MAEIINFNKIRKRKAKLDAERQAAENRVRFGRTRAQKEAEAAALEEARRKLDLLKRDTPPAEED